MSEQADIAEKERLLGDRIRLISLLGWLLWGMSVAGTLAFLVLRLVRLDGNELIGLASLRILAPSLIVLAYLAGYLLAPVRHWYIAATPPENWNPSERASDSLEAWLTHLPMALLGLVLTVSACSVLLSITSLALRGVFFGLAELGVGVLLFLRSTALGRSMVTSKPGRRWFFGMLSLLLVPLYGTLAMQALGQFNAGAAISVLGMLAFAYSLAVSAFTFYGVRALMRASTAQALDGIVAPAEAAVFKEPPLVLNGWQRHRVLFFAWLPLLIALGIGSAIALYYSRILPNQSVPRNGTISIWTGTSVGTFLFILVPVLFFFARSYRGLRLHAQLLEAQEWGPVGVTPERRRALARKVAPAFSVTVLLAGLVGGALLNVLDQAGLFTGMQATLRSLAGPEQAFDLGSGILRWLAGALPDLLVYLGTLVGALVYLSLFFSRPFQRGQVAWREKMLAAEETRCKRIWATLAQRVAGVVEELDEPDMSENPLAPFPPALSDGMLALVYELSKERIERYKSVPIHPFGPLGWIRSIGVTLLLSFPGFLLNHLNLIGQFLGVR